MENGHERRAFSARRHVGRPEIMHHRQAGEAGERRPVADLHGQAPPRRVEHRLPVEADDVDGDPLRRRHAGEVAHRSRMGIRHDPLGGRHHAGPLPSVADDDRLGERLPENGPLRVVVGPEQRRPEAGHAFAFRADQRSVHPVH